MLLFITVSSNRGIDIWKKGYKISLYLYTSKPIGNVEHKERAGN